MMAPRSLAFGLTCSLLAVACVPERPASTGVAPDIAGRCDSVRGAAVAARMRAIAASIENLSGRIVIRQCGAELLDESYGLADRDTGDRMNDRMLFDVGSLTKQFVAATILHLRDRGLLSLDDRLDKHITGLPPQTGAITLHQLLTHSSGLPLYSGEDYDRQTRDQFLQWLREAKLEFAAGTSEAYSNPGFTTLLIVAEQASGEPFEQYLHDNLLAPAGMSHTGYRWVEGTVAINYAADGARDGSPLEHAWAPDGPYWNLRGNGGMLSRADDMARWFEALHGGRVLSARSTREMFAGHVPRRAEASSRHGYGWRINDDDRGHWINHGGSNGATFFADVRWFADSGVVMILTLNTFDQETIVPLVRGFAEAAGKQGS